MHLVTFRLHLCSASKTLRACCKCVHSPKMSGPADSPCKSSGYLCSEHLLRMRGNAVTANAGCKCTLGCMLVHQGLCGIVAFEPHSWKVAVGSKAIFLQTHVGGTLGRPVQPARACQQGRLVQIMTRMGAVCLMNVRVWVGVELSMQFGSPSRGRLFGDGDHTCSIGPGAPYNHTRLRLQFNMQGALSVQHAFLKVCAQAAADAASYHGSVDQS